MSNEDCGSIVCPLCAKPGTVRRFAKGKRKGQLYVQTPCHGLFMNLGKSFQEWILEYMRARDADGNLPPPPPVLVESEPAPPAPVPDAKPEPAPLRSIFFPLFHF
ncbi:hypothetical protein C3942_21785 [Solimonas fluminis]|uniref:Uncharacterized protein n=1 Tax=Solimonas fluminis TaxID=2086571 RepID=A0A2S5TAB4_9GAMM|nr:hypothetical protein [Solimonas fluminis]PPE71788.1 hypothetical protein C3942_21785 [Solimonas fluminis]